MHLRIPTPVITLTPLPPNTPHAATILVNKLSILFSCLLDLWGNSRILIGADTVRVVRLAPLAFFSQRFVHDGVEISGSGGALVTGFFDVLRG